MGNITRKKTRLENLALEGERPPNEAGEPATAIGGGVTATRKAMETKRWSRSWEDPEVSGII